MQNLKYCELFKKFNLYNSNCSSSDELGTIKYACVFLKNEAIIVENDDNVYHLINNAKSKITKLCGKGVIDFAYSYSVVKDVFGYHILALTESGRVYGWGCNTFKQVSFSDKDEILIPERLKVTIGPVPTRVSKSPMAQLNDAYHCCSCWPSTSCRRDPYEKFKLIASGFGHCMAITEDNNIIIWGNNKLGQMGNQQKPTTGDPNVSIHKIHVIDETFVPTCSLSGTLSAGTAFVTQYLQSLIPIKRFQQVKVPKIIEIRENNLRENKIISIACGSFHSLLLFGNGNLYGWGDNRYGQLGHYSHKFILSPMLIKSNIKQIASTNLYTLALTNEGVLYGMGDNTYSQLGNDKQGYYQEPIEVSGFKFDQISTINQLTIGLNKEDNHFYIWGLYKMVKELKIQRNPNRMIEEREERQIIRPGNSGSNGPNFGKIIANTAGVGLVAKGIDSMARSSRDDDRDSEEETSKINDSSEQKENGEHMDKQNEEQDIENEEQNGKESGIESEGGLDDKKVIDQISDEGDEENEQDSNNNNRSGRHNSGISSLAAGVGLLAVANQANCQADPGNVQEGSADNQDAREEDMEKVTYVITKPTKIECNSFEKIIAKVLSLTNFTIKFDESNYKPDENDESPVIDEAILIEVKTGVSESYRQNIKILRQELKKVGLNKVKVYFGDHNKFSVISDSHVVAQGDLDITAKLTGKKIQNHSGATNQDNSI